MYFYTFFRNSYKVLGSIFEMDMKKGDPYLTPSLASINMTPTCRLSTTLTSLLNHEMYPLSGSSSPCQNNFKSVSFSLSLLVSKAGLNFSLKSSHELMDLDERDWHHFNVVDFSNNGNSLNIIDSEAPLYDNVDSNADKWSFGSNNLSYNSIAESCLNYFRA